MNATAAHKHRVDEDDACGTHDSGAYVDEFTQHTEHTVHVFAHVYTPAS